MMQYLKNTSNFNEKEIASEQQSENQAVGRLNEAHCLTPDKDLKTIVPKQEIWVLQQDACPNAGTMTDEQEEKAAAIELKDSATITEDWCGIVSDTENQEAVANVSDSVRRFENMNSINKKPKNKFEIFELNIKSRDKRVIKPKTRMNMTASLNYGI